MMRGEIWLADLGIPFGSEAGFERPILIMQSNEFNRSKISTVLIVPFTTNLALGNAPGNVFVAKEDSGLSKDSVLVVSLLASIDKKRLLKHLGHVDVFALQDLEAGIRLIMAL